MLSRGATRRVLHTYIRQQQIQKVYRRDRVLVCCFAMSSLLVVVVLYFFSFIVRCFLYRACTVLLRLLYTQLHTEWPVSMLFIQNVYSQSTRNIKNKFNRETLVKVLRTFYRIYLSHGHEDFLLLRSIRTGQREISQRYVMTESIMIALNARLLNQHVD